MASSVCSSPQLSKDRAFNDASLALGCWPRNHFTLHKEADTSKQGCVVRQSSWTAAAASSFPFQKNNKNESSRDRGRPFRPSWRTGRQFSGSDCRALLAGSQTQPAPVGSSLPDLDRVYPPVTSFLSLLCDLRQSPFPLWTLTKH